MATPEQMANYYEGYPDPDKPSTWGVLPSGVRNRSFEAAQEMWDAANGPAPKPSPVPGVGMAAARAGDKTAHGGTIGPVTTGVAARVLIGNMPAACMGDPHVCPMFSGTKPHVGGTITKGSATVTIGNKPAARVADLTACTSEPGQIAAGETSVLIGDAPSAGGPLDKDAGKKKSEEKEEKNDEPAPDEEPEKESKPRKPSRSRRRRRDPVADRRRPGESVQQVDTGSHWVSIELVNEVGDPIVGERYRVTLPDGKEVRGALDARGQARIVGIRDTGSCMFTFPRLDMEAWGRAEGAVDSVDSSMMDGTGAISWDELGTVNGPDGAVTGDVSTRGGTWRTARRFDCTSSMASEAGLFWQTIWGHVANEALRKARGNPNVLREGDAVFIPELREKKDAGTTDRHHRFVRHGEPAHLLVRVMVDDEPRCNVPWRMTIDGRRFDGATDADGNVAIPLVHGKRRALLIVGPADDEDEYELDFGAMEPVSTHIGLAARLANLGYLDDEDDSADDIAEALRAFQEACKMGVTGRADEKTRARLLQEHGS